MIAVIARARWLLGACLVWAALFACESAQAQSKPQRKPGAGASADRNGGSARGKGRKPKRDKRAKAAAAPAAAAAAESKPAEAAAAEPEAGKPATAETKPAPAAAAALPADVHTEGDTQVKVMEFSGLDIEGQLKTPQMLYFLNRMRAEFGRPRLPHRSFMPELEQSTKEKAF